MGVCVVCSTRTGRNSKKSFHRFPMKRHPAVAEKWVQWVSSVKKCCWNPCETSVICSDYFVANAFDRSAYRAELNVNSVPTIFNPSYTIPVSDVQLTERKSPSNVICTESPLKKHCGDSADIISRPTSNEIPSSRAVKICTRLGKFSPTEPSNDVTSETSAGIPRDECHTDHRQSFTNPRPQL